MSKTKPDRKAVIQRIDNYNYLKILKDFLGGDLGRMFTGELIYPRQLEIHLPADHKRPCNFNCYYCQGGLLERPLDMDEPKVLKLLEQIGGGKCEYYIYGGAYSEPLMNPYLMDFLRLTKKFGIQFGIHTNGSLLKQLEKDQGFLTEAFGMMDEKDYISVSLDAGTPESHMKTKDLDVNWFDEIIEGIAMMTRLRDQAPKPGNVRVCYLLNRFNSSEDELSGMVRIAKDLQVDSLRFSIPYDQYGKPFEKVRKYKKTVEVPQNQIYEERLKPLISDGKGERPFIFYFPPENQDVDRMRYEQCVYSYYQITLAPDGNVYRCSSIASPSFSYGIVGPIPDNREEFEQLIRKAQDPDFRCGECFRRGARCNRMALEINSAYNAVKREHGYEK
ncbi:MAG: radical SAM protein [Candidatus Omnitrophota bacterium]